MADKMAGTMDEMWVAWSAEYLAEYLVASMVGMWVALLVVM